MIDIKELPKLKRDRIAGEIYLYKERKVKWNGKYIDSRICEFEYCNIIHSYNFEGYKILNGAEKNFHEKLKETV